MARNHHHSELARAPELTIDEVRELGNRPAAETDEDRTKTYDEIRKSYALLKRVDQILGRR
jgi:hypothetical protein